MYRKLSGMDDPSQHRTPRWVKIGGALALVLVVAFAILHLAGGGFRHHDVPSGGQTQSKR
jgi:hypothetical protein